MKQRLRSVFYPRFLALAALAAAALCSCSKKGTETNSQAAPSSAPVDYSPRIGVAVHTSSRTCVAIKNGAITAGTPVTLVNPVSPQSFAEVQVGNQSASPCPITQDAAPSTVSYDLTVPGTGLELPKLVPIVAVVGAAVSSSFAITDAGVQADLDQTHSKNTFRACGANDGVHLTVWRGVPLTGMAVWSGYYYEQGNPGTLPACAAAELTPR